MGRQSADGSVFQKSRANAMNSAGHKMGARLVRLLARSLRTEAQALRGPPLREFNWDQQCTAAATLDGLARALVNALDKTRAKTAQRRKDRKR